MPDSLNPRGPQFNVEDQVEATGPGNPHRGKRGIVIEVISSDNRIYRYRVQFLDGVSETFFGFELRPAS